MISIRAAATITLPEGAIRVTAAQLTAALDQLLDSRSQLARALLGGQPQ
ncbi:MAG TPA: hypothetical protein VF223_01535 [Trebonia sp.]